MIGQISTGCPMDILESPTSSEVATPLFSVVIATYDRGRHILPSVHSVLRQSLQDFELFIIGDGCTDDTGQVLEPLLSDRVRWINLSSRGGSQSFPNNAGLSAARGKFVAYIGHDDIWASDHLKCLREVFLADNDVDFVVSGCLFHGPPDSEDFEVTGIFDNDSAKFEHFFPPSSFAHKLSVIERIGGWRRPLELRAPVDCEFLLRAAEAGLQFRSTGKVTAHKFTSAHRYLSYLVKSSAEQDRFLDILHSPEASNFVARAVAMARTDGQFMVRRHEGYDQRIPGEIHSMALTSRGLEKPPLVPIGVGITIKQTSAYAGLDWDTLRNGRRPYRISGKNPRPKVLVPVTHPGPVSVQVEVVKATSFNVLENLTIILNDAPVSFRIWNSNEGTLLLTFDGKLKAGDYSVLQLDLIPKSPKTGRPGKIGIGNIRLVPKADPLS